MRWIISGSLWLRMSIKGNWRRHGSEVVIRWCQRFFSRRFATRLRGFAAQFCHPQREKNLWHPGYFLVDFRFVSRYFGQGNLYHGQVQKFLAHSFSTTQKTFGKKSIKTAGSFSSALWSSSSIQLWVKTAFHGKNKLLSFHTWLGESEWIFTLEFTCQIFIQ